MAGERGHQAMDYVGDQLISLQAASGGMRLPKHQYPMALLDGNFQLDIPPPGELGDAERHQLTSTGLRSGYTSPLEQESFPTSEEDDEEDEEDDDEEDEHGEEGDLDGEDSSSSGVIPIPPEKPLPKDFKPAINIDQQTESNHDTALTLAAAGGYDELVGYLLDHGARVEHRDKKGCTPLILAASGGYPKTVSILLDHKANIEAQSDRTKDTALSLACSGGKQEVVEMLLNKKANFEHRNVSDYTPLSLAASGGYVHIIKLLLKEGADINSRTGSKLGISPLMLAAMNGHTSTVKLLLDRGSDINAQIETNRNTALTLACFQGRHEVVQLLVERNANVEHRAKTGLTPLMEAASGGYHEVGKVLINRGADVNAAPVPSSKDTALTIAADKGHYKFVELILRYGAHVDVKNKKGNSPLWLAANGGHLDVVRLLVDYKADVDSQDNRKVSCLMAAFRKGHEKVIRYLVKHVNQFPSDSELTRYINTLSDADHAKKCEKCVETIITAKEEQANKAIKNADKLLEEIDAEKKHEEDRKAAAARKRAKKKRQKEKKQQALKAQKEAEVTNGVMGGGDTPPEEDLAGRDDELSVDTIERSLQDENDDSLDNKPTRRVSPHRTPKMDSNTLKPSQSVNSSSTNANISTSNTNAINQRLEQVQNELEIPTKKLSESGKHPKSSERGVDAAKRPASPPVIALQRNSSTASTTSSTTESAHLPTSTSQRQQSKRSKERERERGESASSRSRGGRMSGPRARSQSSGSSDAHIPAPAPPTSVPGTSTAIRVSSSAGVIGVAVGGSTPTNSPRKGRKEDGWKEVGRRTKKVTVPVSVYNLMVSKSSGILASIKQATNTQVDADKHTRQSSSRVLTIRGSVDGIKLTQMILHSLAKDPGQDVQLLIQKSISSLSSGPTPSPSVSSSSVTSSNKRHATSSQGIPLSVPQDIIDSMAPPAKGSNAMVASVNAAISPIVTMSDMTSVKAPIKKPGSGTPSVTQAVSGSIAATKVAVERTSTSTVKPLGSQQQLPVSGKHPGIPGPVEHVPTSKAGLIPFPSTGTFTTVAGSVSSMQMVSSGFNGGNSGSVANTVLTSSSKPVVATVPPAGASGVARRLFSHQHPGNNASSSAGAVPMATSNTTSSLLGPQPANYPAHTATSPHLTVNQASLTTKSTSSHSSKATPHSGLGPVGSSKQPKSHAAAVTASKDKPPPSQPPLSQPKSSTSKMHYSNVISTGTAPGADSQSAPPLMMGGMSSAAADIIEQPMHQIMNTPMLFHDQITRTKKKSTYSDAVGKKNDTSLSGGQSGKMPTLLMHSSHVMGSLPTMQQAQQQQQQQQQLQQQQQQQPKLNLAPGSRPMGPAAASGDKGHGITEPRHGGTSRPLGTAWNDIPGVSPQAVGPPGQAMDRQRPPSSGFQEAFQKYSVYEEESNRLSPPPVVTSGGLGPIGPPNKHSKHPQASVPPPLPPISSSAHTGSIGGKGPSSGPSNIHSFSPSAIHTPHSKTSPPTPSPSQRNEVSPATKSPLLGTAPPGFPPPDGKNSLYFKPIPQQHIVGGEYTRGGESPIPNANPMAASGSNYPTLVPTPVRASRPPLLATPPGYYGSPGPSPDKNSPNKSPPHPNIIKASGFNPNAPTFVPMSSRMQLPPTSSILGPPPKYPPTYPPSQQGGSGGSSILGNAPQLPGGAVGGPSFNTGGPGGSNGGANQSQMMSPSVFAGQGPAPPPPPLPPSQQPPTQQQQQQQQQQPPIASQHMPPPPPPSHPMNHMTPSCSSGSSHQGLPPPLPSNQSSILGQPPTPPLNHHHHMYPPHQQGGTQNFHNAPPARQHGGAHGQAPINPSVPMFGHQLETGTHSLPPPAPPPHPQTGSGLPPPGPPGNFGGLNMMSPYQMPPSGNGPQANIHRQPLQNIGSSVKDPFSSSLDTGGIGTLLPPMPLGGSSNSASPYVAITSSDINKFGIPGQHFPDKSLDDIPGIGGSGGHSILLRPSHDSNPPGGVIGAEVGGGPRNTLPMHSSMSSHPLDNFFGMSIKQLGGLSVSQVEGPSKDGIIGGRAVGSRPSKSTMGMEKFPSSVGLDGFGRQDSLDGTSIHFSSGSSMLNSATTSTSYYVMTPGALPSSSSNSKKDSQFVSTGMVPIGAERAAHKSAALPPAAAFPGFSPNVWSYSNQKSSEESDWLSHLPGHSSQKQEPPALSSTATGGTGQLSGSEVVATSLDNLETVLQKLSLGDYLHLFQKNEIDLNALKLMGETDFAEIGLPPGPCQKLLSAMKSSTQHQPPSRLPEPSRSSSASNQLPPVGSQAFPYSESSSRSSSRPATRPSSRQQHSE